MRGLVVLTTVANLWLLSAACQSKDSDKRPAPRPTEQVGSGSSQSPNKTKIEPIPPPLDIKTPPGDAVKTASGLIYKKLVVNAAGTAPKRNDTVIVNSTFWSQSTGETYNTTRTRGGPQPFPLNQAAPGFVEGLQQMRKGEKAVLWVPPALGYSRPPTTGTPETLVYEVDLVDIIAAPEVPPDIAAPPATAETLKSGTKFVVVRPGTGKDKARSFDTVTFNYTAWDAEGRMVETTEVRKRSQASAPYKQPAGFEEVLTSMTAGERIRFWITADRMGATGKAMGAPQGTLCYEVEVLQIAKGEPPPPVPPDVAKPPADAKKTARGVAYKVLKTGKGGPHPSPTDHVKIHYTGWTAADGRMIETSVVRNEPHEFSLTTPPVTGWTEGIVLMSVGDRYRFWVPEELAYKGAPGRPQGMLVFEIELLEIKPIAKPTTP